MRNAHFAKFPMYSAIVLPLFFFSFPSAPMISKNAQSFWFKMSVVFCAPIWDNSILPQVEFGHNFCWTVLLFGCKFFKFLQAPMGSPTPLRNLVVVWGGAGVQGVR